MAIAPPPSMPMPSAASAADPLAALRSQLAGELITPEHADFDDAVVIDLSRMKDIAIDPTTRVARVGTGATSGDLAGPAHVHGLALSTGDTHSIGIGGGDDRRRQLQHRHRVYLPPCAGRSDPRRCARATR